MLTAVQHCWASANSDRTAAYRGRQGLWSGAPAMAVLVQQLIPGDVSAVAFSANPVTQNREEVLINASWGLGESLVGGMVTPDSFAVQRSTSQITAQINNKERMTVATPGGTAEVPVPSLFRRRACLDDQQVKAIAHLATELEQAMGWPVDVECTYAGGQLFLLQCRPITTLAQR